MEISRLPDLGTKGFIVRTKQKNGFCVAILKKRKLALKYRKEFPGPYIAISLWFFGIYVTWGCKGKEDVRRKNREQRTKRYSNLLAK